MTSVSISFDQEILDAIDAAIDDQVEYANRSHFVQVACKKKLVDDGRLRDSEFDASV